MNLLARLMAALGWPPPSVIVSARHRRARTTCEFCGKDVAIIASTGRLWAHRCTQPAASSSARESTNDQ